MNYFVCYCYFAFIHYFFHYTFNRKMNQNINTIWKWPHPVFIVRWTVQCLNLFMKTDWLCVNNSWTSHTYRHVVAERLTSILVAFLTSVLSLWNSDWNSHETLCICIINFCLCFASRKLMCAWSVVCIQDVHNWLKILGIWLCFYLNLTVEFF